MFENRDPRPQKDESNAPLTSLYEKCVLMCREAAAATDEMQYGRAMRAIEQAIEVADGTQWSDNQGILMRSTVREAGAKLAMLRGDLVEAADLYNQAMAIRGQVLGYESKETQQVKAMKAESLAELGQVHESLTLWNEIVDWADGKKGTALARVSTRLSRGRVLLRAELEEASMHEVSSALLLVSKVPSERKQALAHDLLDQAGKFEDLGDFATAYALMKQGITIIESRLDGTPADAVEVDALRLELAKLASGAGLDEVARSIHQTLLQSSSTIKGEGHPDTMDIRERLAMIAFEQGDFVIAEAQARRNFELAVQQPESRDLIQRGLTLNWLFERMGRPKAANEILHEMHGVLGGIDQVEATPATIDGSHYINVSELVKGLKAGIDIHELLDQSVPDMPAASRNEVKAGLMTAMALDLVKNKRDVPLAEEVLAEVDSILMSLPPHLHGKVLEDAEKARIAIAVVTRDFEQEIALREAGITRFQREHGLGRGVTYAAMLSDMASAYARAGFNPAALESVKEAQSVLRHFGATKSFLYGKLLQQKAAVLPEWDARVERYREQAERILRRYAGE